MKDKDEKTAQKKPKKSSEKTEEKEGKNKKAHPPEAQTHQPGLEYKMKQKPKIDDPSYAGSGKLEGKIALITGGDSGIGAATAIAFAKEGADVAIGYLEEHEDAKNVQKIISSYGKECLLISGNIRDEDFCRKMVEEVFLHFGALDIVVNNAAEQHEETNIENITKQQIEKTFQTNIFSMFHVVKAAVPHLKKGAAIINTASITAYRGNVHLMDYAATKGAIVTFTRSLSQSLMEKGIRVNAVAPGAVWTPLIVSSFKAEEIETFGTDNAMGRAAQPCEIAPSFVFLASQDASFMSGQVLHPNGGEMVES